MGGTTNSRNVTMMPTMMAFLVFLLVACLIVCDRIAVAFSPLTTIRTPAAAGRFHLIASKYATTATTAAKTTTTTTARSRYGRSLLWPLRSDRVIRYDESDYTYDTGRGGVRLANENAIVISGTVQHKPGSAKAQVSNLQRYTTLTALPDDQDVVCTGRGTELYKDPGEGTENVIFLAPIEAVKDAFAGASGTNQASRLQVNFLGGDDLQVLEVTAAAEQLVLMLDVPTACKISFASLSHSSFELGKATVTVVDRSSSSGKENENEEEKPNGEEDDAPTKAASGSSGGDNDGLVFWDTEGKWWTVLKENINLDIA